MYKGYKVIDGDGHMYEPVDMWDKYVEKEYYDQRPIIDQVHERALLTYKTTDLIPGNQFAGALRAKTLTQDIPTRFIGCSFVLECCLGCETGYTPLSRRDPYRPTELSHSIFFFDSSEMGCSSMLGTGSSGAGASGWG